MSDSDAQLADEIPARTKPGPGLPQPAADPAAKVSTGPERVAGAGPDPAAGTAVSRHHGLRRRGLAHWLAVSTGFGLIGGPLVAMAVDHGHPHAAVVAIVAAPLAVLAALFVAAGIGVLHWTWRAALCRAAAVIVFGSVVFVLPNAVNLPATGDFWWATVLEKYAVSCLPYPFVGWLVMPGIRRRLAVEVCVVLTACLALVWPALLRAMRDQTADVLRRELALPQSMLYVLDMPDARTVNGYHYTQPAVSLGYRLPRDTAKTSAALDHPDPGYDVDIAVYPATDSSPCTELPKVLLGVDGFERTGMSCAAEADGVWRASETGKFGTLDDVTEIELIDGDYVAVTIGQQSRQFDGEFPVLFADLRHPTSAQLVTVGLAGGPSPLE